MSMGTTAPMHNVAAVKGSPRFWEIDTRRGVALITLIVLIGRSGKSTLRKSLVGGELLADEETVKSYPGVKMTRTEAMPD